MFALSYFMSLFKVGWSLKNLILLYSIFVFALKTSPKKPEALTNPNSMEKDDKDKIQNKICAEKVFTARAEMEFMTDSEESGLEYSMRVQLIMNRTVILLSMVMSLMMMLKTYLMLLYCSWKYRYIPHAMTNINISCV